MNWFNRLMQRRKDIESSSLMNKTNGEIITELTGGRFLVHGKPVYELALEYKNTKITSTCLDIHIDGLLTAIGTSNSEIIIMDIRSGEIAARLKSNDEKASGGSVVTVSFSSNGYWLFSIDEHSVISVWDLRRSLLAFKIDPYDGKVGEIGKNDKKIVDMKVDKFNQFMVILKQDGKFSQVDIFKYLKKGKNWVKDDKLSGKISLLLASQFDDEDGDIKKKIIGIHLLKESNEFAVMRDDLKLIKFNIEKE